MLSVMFVGYIVLRAAQSGARARPPAEPPQGWARWGRCSSHVLPLVLIFAVVVGAMTAGWATPTEAAALGAPAPSSPGSTAR
jgi:TRAP-type C4-dicarboxylate transport system permease large subunit